VTSLETGGRAAESAVALDGIAKKFGAFVALRGVTLAIEPGEFVCVLGPSGCGKTTLLRIVAELERQNAGRVLMAGRDVSGLPPRQRDYGIVFQSYALFPNLITDPARDVGSWSSQRTACGPGPLSGVVRQGDAEPRRPVRARCRGGGRRPAAPPSRRTR
jgi:hypothetical protein